MRAFNEIPGYAFFEVRENNIVHTIQQAGKDYILGVDETEYKAYLLDKYSLELLSIISDSETIAQPKVIKRQVEDFRRDTYNIDVYRFTIKYQFQGDEEIFKIRPSTFRMVSYDITTRSNEVSYSFEVTKQDPAEYERNKTTAYNAVFANLTNANNDVTSWNSRLKGFIESEFNKVKNKYLGENSFFTAINLKQNTTNAVYTVPAVNKKAIPQVPKAGSKEFSSEPIIAQSLYEDILKLIYDNGKNIEKKPSLYIGKDEEALRDQFILLLETKYEGVTASAEAFNRGGKTDILLKNAGDGSNLFVAECKIWRGAKEFLAAISQLFDRYLTWRDSKVALMIFVKTKNMSEVVKTVQKEITSHPYFVKANGNRGESSLSYIFHLPQDSSKHVQLEVMLFHYDKA